MALISPVSAFQQPNYMADSGSAYPLKIDASLNALARLGAMFAPYPTLPASMSVVISPGYGWISGTHTEISAQSVTIGAAPGSNSRIDRIVIYRPTGVVSVIAGTPGASPVAPAIPAKYLPIAQVTVAAGTTAITAAMIADERDIISICLAPGSVGQTEIDAGAIHAEHLASGTINASTLDSSVRILQPGMIIYTAGSAAPSGTIKANGAAVSRTTYAALFSAIGTIWGAGDGATTFNLPDLRGMFPRGLDDGRGIDAGRGLGSGQGDDLRSHGHSVSAGHSLSVAGGGGHSHSVNWMTGANSQHYSGVNWSTDNVIVGGTFQTSSVGDHSHAIDGGINVSISNTGGSETRPINAALLASIVY